MGGCSNFGYPALLLDGFAGPFWIPLKISGAKCTAGFSIATVNISCKHKIEQTYLATVRVPMSTLNKYYS